MRGPCRWGSVDVSSLAGDTWLIAKSAAEYGDCGKVGGGVGPSLGEVLLGQHTASGPRHGGTPTMTRMLDRGRAQEFGKWSAQHGQYSDGVSEYGMGQRDVSVDDDRASRLADRSLVATERRRGRTMHAALVGGSIGPGRSRKFRRGTMPWPQLVGHGMGTWEACISRSLGAAVRAWQYGTMRGGARPFAGSILRISMFGVCALGAPTAILQKGEVLQRHTDAEVGTEKPLYDNAQNQDAWEFMELSFVAHVRHQARARVAERAAPGRFRFRDSVGR